MVYNIVSVLVGTENDNTELTTLVVLTENESLFTSIPRQGSIVSTNTEWEGRSLTAGMWEGPRVLKCMLQSTR